MLGFKKPGSTLTSEQGHFHFSYVSELCEYPAKYILTFGFLCLATTFKMPIFSKITHQTVHLVLLHIRHRETQNDSTEQWVQVYVEGGGGGRGTVKFHTFFFWTSK